MTAPVKGICGCNLVSPLFVCPSCEAIKSSMARINKAKCPSCNTYNPSGVSCNNDCETFMCKCGKSYYAIGSQSILGHSPKCGNF